MAYRYPYRSAMLRQRSRRRYRTRRIGARARLSNWGARRFKTRHVPIAALLATLLMTMFNSAMRTEESLWKTCETLYQARDAKGIDVLKRYQQKYPESERLDDAAYYQARLTHQAEPTPSGAKTAWEAVLNSPDPSRRIEARRRLGDCAAYEKDIAAAFAHYQAAASSGIVDEHSTAATFGAGVAADSMELHGEALLYLRALWKLPAEPYQRIRASRLLQKRALPAVQNSGGKERSYVVKRGESLTRIARRFDVGLNRLIRANPNVQPNRIRIGQTLSIPSGAGEMSALLSLSDRSLFLVQNKRLVCPFPTVGVHPQAAALGTYKTARLDSHATAHSGAGRIELSGGLVIMGGASEEELLDSALSPEIRLTDEEMRKLMPMLRQDAQFTILNSLVAMDWAHVPAPTASAQR